MRTSFMIRSETRLRYGGTDALLAFHALPFARLRAASCRRGQLYDRHAEEVTLDGVERVLI